MESLQTEIDLASQEKDGYWNVLTRASDMEKVASELKAAIDTSLIPAARHEIEELASPPLAGTRYERLDEERRNES